MFDGFIVGEALNVKSRRNIKHYQKLEAL